MLECPVCRTGVFREDVPLSAVRREIRMRQDFVFSRVSRDSDPAELKDLTDFMHGFASPLVRCARCGTLLRNEVDVREAGSYEEDPNDRDLMRQLLPRYIAAFRKKQNAYVPLIRPHAEVLELGSHLGAFLQTAEEWGWNARALDVGKDTSEFARSNGFRVHQQLIEESTLSPATFDAVFIWNCFDQISNPNATLEGVHRVLKRDGLLTVRVPNATFYRMLQGRLRSRRIDPFVLKALAYNNLLGFPYLYGYTAESLNGLLLRNGFEQVRGFNSELITMPFADPRTSVEQEEAALSDAVARWSTHTTFVAGQLTGPWIEIVYRKMPEFDWKRRIVEKSAAPVISLPRRNIDRRFLERAA